MDRAAKLFGSKAIVMDTPHIISMFDNITPTYDKLNTWFSFGLDAYWRKELVKAIPVKRGKILDSCTGTGKLAFLMAEKGYQVTGIDLSLPMLNLAEKNKKTGNTVEFCQADALKLPFSDSSFSAVTSAFALRNLPDLIQAFRESYRVLDDKGTALFLDLTPPSFPFARPFHRFYLMTLLPLVGKIVSKDPKAYHYLGASILKFKTRTQIAEILKSSGFREVQISLLSGGIATLWKALK